MNKLSVDFDGDFSSPAPGSRCCFAALTAAAGDAGGRVPPGPGSIPSAGRCWERRCPRSFSITAGGTTRSHLHHPQGLDPAVLPAKGLLWLPPLSPPPCAVPSCPHPCPGSSARVTRRWMVPVTAPVRPRRGVTVIYDTICGSRGARQRPWPRCAAGCPGDTAIPRTLLGTMIARALGGTGAVPVGAVGNVSAASSSHGVVGAGAAIPLDKSKQITFLRQLKKGDKSSLPLHPQRPGFSAGCYVAEPTAAFPGVRDAPRCPRSPTASPAFSSAPSAEIPEGIETERVGKPQGAASSSAHPKNPPRLKHPHDAPARSRSRVLTRRCSAVGAFGSI